MVGVSSPGLGRRVVRGSILMVALRLSFRLIGTISTLILVRLLVPGDFGLVALALLVGYRTRIATIFSWVLLISLQARNVFITQGGDALTVVLLFWGLFRWIQELRHG